MDMLRNIKTQSITISCMIRDAETNELLEEYSNAKIYFLNGENKPLALAPSLTVRNHSPAGFNHGYSGSGPAQLALAICLKLYPQRVAQAVYQYFKSDYIAKLPSQGDEFQVTLQVPTNPLSYWQVEPLMDWEYSEGGEELPAAEAKPQQQSDTLQQEHDQAYQNALKLPASTRFDFNGVNGHANFAYIRLVSDYRGKVLVIATDPGEANHLGITNSIEYLAAQVYRAFKLDPTQTLFVERTVEPMSLYQYQVSRQWKFVEQWDLVNFTYCKSTLTNPEWSPVSEQNVSVIKDLL